MSHWNKDTDRGPELGGTYFAICIIMSLLAVLAITALSHCANTIPHDQVLADMLYKESHKRAKINNNRIDSIIADGVACGPR